MTIFTGSDGDDTLAGTSGDDIFHLEDGGADMASGDAGFDLFDMGGSFDASDRLDGGADYDRVILDGNYLGGVSIGGGMLTDIEEITLTAGHNYVLTILADASAGMAMINGSALGPGDNITIDASQRLQDIEIVAGASSGDRLYGGLGSDSLYGGAGSDQLFGGAGNDQLIAGGGSADRLDGGDGNDVLSFGEGFQKSDRAVGGAGDDILVLQNGVAKRVVFDARTMSGIEQLVVSNGAYDLTLHDDNVAAGARLIVRGVTAAGFRLDGSHETDGRFFVTGGDGSDTITGGAGKDYLSGKVGDDTLIGGAGDDTLIGGGGAGQDKLVGGLGSDALAGSINGGSRFFYLDVSDSTPDAHDLIATLRSGDVIWLRPIDADTTRAGNQAFHLVSALGGHAGELALSFDAGAAMTDIQGDIDGDGVADLLIQVDGDHTGFTSFVL